MATTDAITPEIEGPDPDCYRKPDEQVRPGDIVKLSPTFRSLKNITHVGNETQHKQQRIVNVLSGPSLTQVLSGAKDSKLVAPGRHAWGVLLTRGCDIDGGPERQVAVLRPLSEFPDHEVQAAIIDGKHNSTHFVPESSVFPDSAVDFRFIITLHRNLFATLERPISLTLDALVHLYFRWMQHVIGKHIPDTVPCDNCQHPVEVFQQMKDLATPTPDQY